jgi:undecaprenyl-diphosphatase
MLVAGLGEFLSKIIKRPAVPLLNIRHRPTDRAASRQTVDGAAPMNLLSTFKAFALRDFGLVAAAFLLLALAVGFGLLTDEVMEGDTTAFDLAVITALRTDSNLADPLGPPWVEEMARDVTSLGSYVFLGFVLVATVGYLLLIGKRPLAALMAVSVLGGTLVNTALKYGFDRPRPDLQHAARVFTPSFPSAHATLATITFLTLGVLLTRSTTDWRLKAYFTSVAVIMTVTVGFSRVYLGLHFASDVVAGWILGAAWALLCWTIVLWLQRRYGV